MLSTISEEEETQEALVEPLLFPNNSNKISETNPNTPEAQQHIADESSWPQATTANSVSVEMSSTNIAGSPSPGAGASFGRRLTDIRFCPPFIQGVLFRLLAFKTMADVLPFPFNHVVTNGKMAVPAYLGVNFALILLWLPFWLLSFLLTELGIYLIGVGTIFLVGRSIIRFIAFPGASKKMMLDMEREFSKYALRMLVAAAESSRETASCLLQACSANPNQSAKDMLPAYWKRTETYRNRVLAVFTETLMVLYQEHSAESFQMSEGDLTKYGNNRLSGDIGNLSTITPEARASGRELMQHLQQLLHSLNDFEGVVKTFTQKGGIFADGVSTAKKLIEQSTNLLAFCESLRRAGSEELGGDNDNDDEEDPVETVRRQMEEGNKSTLDAVRSGLSSLQTMLDPHPHPSVFCMDFQRGCVLSRFRGSRQKWVRRPSGGMIDVLHFPAKGVNNNSRAVLYCNPNAGLVEVATGLNMVGGNVPASEADPSAPKDTWTDFYTEQGFDVYLFNYAGYGRSNGPGVCSSSVSEDVGKSCMARFCRIFNSFFLAFKPRPDTLRSDGIAVAEHILDSGAVDQLFIHGESIGGMAASGVAKHLTNKPSTRSKVSLLVCDRTFCNLEAIAQRLVGEWTGNAIRALTLYSWSTDVAGDFLKSQCPKVVAQDAADAIIADDASLKSGVALWKEVHRGAASTAHIAWMKEVPLRYRMADFENGSVDDAKYVAFGSRSFSQPPMWPTDKHVSLEEAAHFAACCKRIGKTATAMKRTLSLSDDEDQSGPNDHLLIQVWKYLATCDGLVGAPLGTSVKRGFDASTAWLCSTLVFGGQAVVASAESRLGGLPPGQAVVIDPVDFDQTPPSDKAGASEGFMHPSPIPAVATFLEQALEGGDSHITALAHEIKYVAATLRYVQARLSAASIVQQSLAERRLGGLNENSVGSFLHLHCGHNNAFSNDEKENLRFLIKQAMVVPKNPSGPQQV